MELRGNLLISYYDHSTKRAKNGGTVARTVDFKGGQRLKNPLASRIL